METVCLCTGPGTATCPSEGTLQLALATRPRAFVRLMNERAQAMGLACTRYTTPSGIRDAGNHSCAADLAAIARAVLRQPRLRRIVRERSADAAVPDRGRQALPLQHEPAAARALPRHDGAQDRLHGRGGTLPGGHRAARRRRDWGSSCWTLRTRAVRRSGCWTSGSPPPTADPARPVVRRGDDGPIRQRPQGRPSPHRRRARRRARRRRRAGRRAAPPPRAARPRPADVGLAASCSAPRSARR